MQAIYLRTTSSLNISASIQSFLGAQAACLPVWQEEAPGQSQAGSLPALPVSMGIFMDEFRMTQRVV
jgi:hypothetical protein